MAASNIKLIYFNFEGRADVSRLLLTVAGKQFEDVRLEADKWSSIKPTMPFGQVPVLELDGKMYGQSQAIANFLAREFDLYGKTNLDALKIDQVSQLMEDFIKAVSKSWFEKDPTKKAAIQKTLKEEDGPKFLGFFEKLLKENGTGHFVGDSLSLADIIVFDMCTGFLKTFVAESMDKFPMVKALAEKVGSNEKIKAFVAAQK